MTTMHLDRHMSNIERNKHRRRRAVTFDSETEVIRANMKTPRAKRRHRFTAAEWTHKNGHPRCLTCGDEERTGGICDGIFEKVAQDNPQRAARHVAVPRYGLITRHATEAWEWVQRAMAHGDSVVAEPVLRGERTMIRFDGPPPATLEAVLHVDPTLGSVASAFDAVTYGQTDLRRIPLRQRRRFLTRAIGLLGRKDLLFVPQHRVDSRAALTRAVDRIRRNGAPGVLLKIDGGEILEGVSDEWAHLRFEEPESVAIVEPWDAAALNDIGETRAAQEKDVQKGLMLVPILCQQVAQQIAIGVVMEPDVADTQGDGTMAGEIEAAANQFMQDYRAGRTILRLDHKQDLGDDDAILTQHYIAPNNLDIGGQPVRAGSWVQAWKYSDVVWPRILSGEFTGFSIGGFARKVPA